MEVEAGIREGSGGPYWYKLYSLMVCSELALPEAACPVPAPQTGDDVVQIRFGHVPATLANGRRLTPWVEYADNKCLYSVDGICRMLVEDGSRIIIDPLPSVPESDIRAFLLGSGLGTILHQRRLVPLHVSAVHSPIGTLAFTGASGAGKSTIAAALAKYNDWPILCDDMAVLRPDDSEPVLHLGTRRSKLWRDAISALDLGSREAQRDVSRLDKFHLTLDNEVEAVAAPIGYLFNLEWGDALTIRELSPAHRFALAMNAIYRPYLASMFGEVSVARETALTVSRQMRAFELTRPRQLHDLGAVAAAVRALVERQAGQAPSDH